MGIAVICYFKDGAIKDEKVVTHRPKPPHTDSRLSLKLFLEPPSAGRVGDRKLLLTASPTLLCSRLMKAIERSRSMAWEDHDDPVRQITRGLSWVRTTGLPWAVGKEALLPDLKMVSQARVCACHTLVLRLLCSSTGVTIIFPNVLIIWKNTRTWTLHSSL